MRVHYTFQQSTIVDGTIDLDEDTVRALRDARNSALRHSLLDPLIAEHALSEPEAAKSTHLRQIDFRIDATTDTLEGA